MLRNQLVTYVRGIFNHQTVSSFSFLKLSSLTFFGLLFATSAQNWGKHPLLFRPLRKSFLYWDKKSSKPRLEFWILF